MTKNFTIQDFFKRFPDDDACLNHLMKLRYGEVIDCPKCGKHGKFSKISKIPAFQCAWCGHHIHPMAGTPFERSRTPLQKWFYAMYLFTTTRHGVPAKELQRQLGITYKTAWRIGHEIRKYMGKIDGDSGLSGHVEADEAFMGGKPRPRNNAGRIMLSDNTKKPKTVVFGMVQRAGDLITRVVPDARKTTLIPLIEQYVAKGTVLSTDEWKAYKSMTEKGYKHGTVNHHQREYVRGIIHTNTIEGFWSHFKNSVRGTHKSISPKHMMNYLHEFEFRFNLRRDVSGSMFDRLIQAF
jgi:transposase